MTNKIETLNKRLKEVKEKFDALQKSGIDHEILEIYLANKTLLPRRDVKKLLSHLEDFYDRLIKKDILKNLEND
ncbi:hypothetical protein LCGC14_2812410 [marine sediment metagenome]|uniref:Uncharacterized protein n=1 Tax=marine sediment metagenome TaxID=412755 RepID=A0A0F9ASW8_9ZZZZ